MLKKIVLFQFWILFLLQIACAQEKKPVPKENSLKKAVSEFVEMPDVKNGIIGFYAIDIATNEVIAEHNGDIGLLPASTQKLFTTSTALEVFGSKYRFTTELMYDGTIDTTSRTLHGNIYIKGGGDPVFASEKFKETYFNPVFWNAWVEVVKQLKIEKIEGAIIGDASIYNSQSTPSTWSWADIGNYYGAGVSGLSIYDNLYKLELSSSSSTGGTTSLQSISPTIPNIYFTNEVTAAANNQDNAYIFGAPYTDVRYIRGTIPKGKSNFTIKGSIPEPALVAAVEFDRILKENGITIKNTPTTKRILEIEKKDQPSDRKKIASTQSPNLSDIVNRTNLWSVNLYAEHLATHLGFVKQQKGDTESGCDFIKSFWATKGMDTNGLFLHDGCGLSRYNSITPKQMVFMLRYMKRESKNFEVFKNSLPVAGTSGTLRSMCKGTVAQGNVSAKSGSIGRVRAYAGYATTQSGREVAFFITANNFTCNDSTIRKRMADLMVKIAGFSE